MIESASVSLLPFTDSSSSNIKFQASHRLHQAEFLPDAL
jgi:hypothetical protein